jgi:hypothetical protein
MGLPLSRRIVFSQPLITEKSVAEIQKFDDPRCKSQRQLRTSVTSPKFL